MPRPRILFFGYSEVGYECLDLLFERGDNVVALITHQDNPNEKIWFKTPALAAGKRGLPIFTPEKVNTPEWIERIAGFLESHAMVRAGQTVGAAVSGRTLVIPGSPSGSAICGML